MKRMTVADVMERLPIKQKFTVIEGEVKAPIYEQLCRITNIYDFKDRALWKTINKRVVHSLVIKDDVLYMYVEEAEDK